MAAYLARGDTEPLLAALQTDGDVRLPSGAPARLAVYFPQTDDLEELRPTVEASLAGLGLPTTLVLEHTSKTPKENEDAFNRLAHDPEAPHRVILLVNKGTEGWNCPRREALALVKPDGFRRELEDGAEVYTAEITYRKDRESLLLSWEQLTKDNPGGFGFHYSAYEITDFISPTIIERLNMDQTLFRARITEWRAMVDSVMIDPAYDGHVFNIGLADVPDANPTSSPAATSFPPPPAPPRWR